MKFLKYLLITLGALLVALIVLVTGVAVFAPASDTPLAVSTIGDKTVKLYAKGNAGFSSTTTGAEVSITVYERTVQVKGDGNILVDGKPLETPPYKELAVYIHPDKKIETVVVQGP